MRLSNFKFIGRCKSSECSAADDAIEATVDMTTGYLWWKTTTTYHARCAALSNLPVGRWVIAHKVFAPRLPQKKMNAMYNEHARNCIGIV